MEQGEGLSRSADVASLAGCVTGPDTALGMPAGGTGVGAPDVPMAQEIPGRYEVLREQGSGGIGRVLLVNDRYLRREIALKELLKDTTASEVTAAGGSLPGTRTPEVVRFLREAHITAALEHPSIVPLYEMGQRNDGTLYYTMKLIRGRTLEQALRDAQGLAGRLALLPSFIALCEAIAYAHSRGVVHRDIKPSNVLLGEFGETVAIDWGLATKKGGDEDRDCSHAAPDPGHEDEEPADRLTRYGQSLGTPGYMSPEQIRGDLTKVAEPSDVYALGTVLYALLTGRRPYEERDIAELFRAVLARDPLPVKALEPHAPAELAAICMRAMRREPGARYASAGELVQELKRFQAGALVEAYKYNPMDRLRRFVRRHRSGIAAAAVAMAAVVLVTVLAFLRVLKAQERIERALYLSSINLAKASIDTDRVDDAILALDKAPAGHRHLEWGLLHELAHPELLTLRFHEGPISDAQYSPDGAMIATCGHDGRLALWDARTGALLRTVVVDEADALHRLDWSPDSTRVATATRGETIEIRDAATLTPLRTFSGYAPAFGGDGGVLAAATSFGRQVTVFDTKTGATLHNFTDSKDYLIWLDISPDGRWLAGGNNEGSLYVWNLETGAQAWASLRLHYPSVRRVEFAPDSETLISAGADRMARIWDVQTGACIRTFDGRDGGIGGSFALIADGQLLITGSNDRTALVWDVATGETLWQMAGYPAQLGFIAASPDGRSFVTSDGGSGRAVFPVVPASHRRTLKEHRGWVWTAVFSPDGSLLATGGGNRDYKDKRLLLWDPVTGELLRTIETGAELVQSFAFCDRGRQVVVAGSNGNPVLYDVATGAPLHTFTDHETQMNTLAVSPDGRFLATTSADKVGVIWDLATREPIGRLQCAEGEFCAAVFHPSGRWLATAERLGGIRIWEVPGGLQVHAIPVAQRYEPRLAFSPDGRWLATGTMDGDIHLWDVEGWRLARTFEGHTGYVGALAFSTDSQRLVSGGRDNAVRIWDVDAGEQVLCIEQHSDLVNTVAFSPGDRFLVTGGRDGTVILWPIQPWQAAL